MMYDKPTLRTAFRTYEFALESAYQQFVTDGTYSKVLWMRVDRCAAKLRAAAKQAPKEIKTVVDRLVGDCGVVS